MGKRAKIVVYSLIALIAAATLWLPLALSDAQKRIESSKVEAEETANEILILLASGWEPSSLMLRTSPKLSTDDPQFRSLLAKCRTELGSLQSGDMKISTFRVDDSDIKNPVLLAALSAEAWFERGPAQVTMSLVRKPGNAWMLDAISIVPIKSDQESSGRFLDHAPSAPTQGGTAGPR